MRNSLVAPFGVTVRNAYDAETMILSWNPVIDLSDPVIGYNVYRSESADGGFEKINENLIHVTDYTDATAKQKLRTAYWYKVTAVHDGGFESPPSDPVTYRPTSLGRLGPVMKEIVRRHKFILDNDGEYVHLLVRKTIGKRCASFDPRRQQAANHGQCPTCYGTSFEGGYILVPNVLMRIARSQSNISWDIAGRDIQHTPRGWCLDSPMVHSNDIIVDFYNRRFEVSGIAAYTPVAASVSRQEFSLIELEPSHIIYTFPVPEVKAR